MGCVAEARKRWRCFLLETTLVCVMLPLLASAQAEKPALAYHLTHVDTGEPFPSPDGKKIVFESKVAGYYELFTMNPDGSGVAQVTHDAWNHDTPSWSPDGSKFALFPIGIGIPSCT